MLSSSARPLTSFEDVSRYKDLVKHATSERTMPPWPPASDCNDDRGDRSLSEEQIAAVARWVDEGAPAGAPADGPADDRRLTRVDLELSMAEPYTPRSAHDDYRCFVLDWPARQTTFVTGIGTRPGVPALLHHMIAFIAPPGAAAEYEALDAAEPGPGYTCYGSPGGTSAARWMGAWAPGVTGVISPSAPASRWHPDPG